MCDGLKIAQLAVISGGARGEKHKTEKLPLLSSTFLLHLVLLPPLFLLLADFASLHGASSEPEPLWQEK